MFILKQSVLKNTICIFQMNIRNFSSPIRMAYNSYGRSPQNKIPPVIIMHGLFGMKQNWRSVCRNLESKLDTNLFVIDARNHGESPHTLQHNSALMAADVNEFVKNMGFDKVNVIGHSMGGRTMMHFALEHPNLVNKAVIVDISPISLPHDFSFMEHLILTMERISIPSNLTLSGGRKLARSQLVQRAGEGTADFILLNLKKREGTGEFYWSLNLKTLLSSLSSSGHFSDHISGYDPFKGPTMFIGGRSSHYIQENEWPEIQKIFPNSELHWVDAGHLIHFEQPIEFVNLVTNFLTK